MLPKRSSPVPLPRDRPACSARVCSFPRSKPCVEGDGVYLREPQMSDYKAWAALRAQSRAFLEPWEPRWARDELTRDTYRRCIRYYYRDARQDLGYAFFLFRTSDNALIGGITLSNIRRGVSRAAPGILDWRAIRPARPYDQRGAGGYLVCFRCFASTSVGGGVPAREQSVGGASEPDGISI